MECIVNCIFNFANRIVFSLTEKEHYSENSKYKYINFEQLCADVLNNGAFLNS